MENCQPVSLEEWRALYKESIEFKNLACWDWMYDADLIGVCNPETDEVAYCSVLGNLGEMFALNVYPGSEGLASFLYFYEQSARIMEGESVDQNHLFMSQKCVSLSFEDRSELEKRDLNIIRKLGLKPRGRKAWPQFRSYRPGYVPWFLTAPEVRLLTVALQQHRGVACRLRDDPGCLDAPEEGHYLIRVRRDGRWVDTWQEPAPFEQRKPVPVVNELQLAQLKRQSLVCRGTWDVDAVPLPIIIEEGERPFYPYGIAIMDHSGLAIAFEVIQPGTLEKEVPEKFLSAIQNTETLPQIVRVQSEQALDLLTPICNQLKITVQSVSQLDSIDYLLSHFEQFISR